SAPSRWWPTTMREHCLGWTTPCLSTTDPADSQAGKGMAVAPGRQAARRLPSDVHSISPAAAIRPGADRYVGWTTPYLSTNCPLELPGGKALTVLHRAAIRTTTLTCEPRP